MRCWGARARRENHETKHVLPPRSGLEIWVWELILSGLEFVPENRASPAEKKAKQTFLWDFNFQSTALYLQTSFHRFCHLGLSYSPETPHVILHPLSQQLG